MKCFTDNEKLEYKAKSDEKTEHTLVCEYFEEGFNAVIALLVIRETKKDGFRRLLL